MIQVAWGALLAATVVAGGLCFLSAVLWATGWAVLLPEPVRLATAWTAAITVGAWIVATGVWGLRESVKYFREWLTDERRRLSGRRAQR